MWVSAEHWCNRSRRYNRAAAAAAYIAEATTLLRRKMCKMLVIHACILLQKFLIRKYIWSTHNNRTGYHFIYSYSRILSICKNLQNVSLLYLKDYLSPLQDFFLCKKKQIKSHWPSNYIFALGTPYLWCLMCSDEMVY